MQHTNQQTSFAVFFALAASSTLTAQANLLSVEGTIVGDRYGEQIANAFDVDADGHDDVIIGMPLHSNGDGLVEVRSGRTGALIHSWPGTPGMGNRFGSAVAGVGDLNGDGHSEVAFTRLMFIGLTQVTRVQIMKGASGIWHNEIPGSVDTEMGFSLAGGGDSDGDGRLELLVGEPSWMNPGGFKVGRVRVYELTNLVSNLGNNFGTVHDQRFGHSVAWIGDVTLDGLDDFVVGSPGIEMTPGITAGRVDCIKLASQSVWQRNGLSPGANQGWSVAGIADVNSDGSPDVITGAPEAVLERGLVRILDGDTGISLDVRFGDDVDDRLGESVLGLDDLDGDGIADLAVGAPGDGTQTIGFSHPGLVHIMSGTDLSALGSERGFGSFAAFGTSLTSVGDFTGDGKLDFVVGSTFPDILGFPGTGRISFFDAASAGASCTTYGTGLAGTFGVPELTCSATPRVGTTFNLMLENSSGTPQLGAFVAGKFDVAAPLYGGTLYMAPTIVNVVPVVPIGGIDYPLSLPQDHLFSGQRWLVQGLQVDLGAVQGVSMSKPVEMIFGGF